MEREEKNNMQKTKETNRTFASVGKKNSELKFEGGVV